MEKSSNMSRQRRGWGSSRRSTRANLRTNAISAFAQTSIVSACFESCLVVPPGPGLLAPVLVDIFLFRVLFDPRGLSLAVYSKRARNPALEYRAAFAELLT